MSNKNATIYSLYYYYSYYYCYFYYHHHHYYSYCYDYILLLLFELPSSPAIWRACLGYVTRRLGLLPDQAFSLYSRCRKFSVRPCSVLQPRISRPVTETEVILSMCAKSLWLQICRPNRRMTHHACELQRYATPGDHSCET